jgi:GTP-binding protein YchF
MKDVAIVGLPGSGKSTVFTAVSRHVAQRGSASQAVVEVPDDRLDLLAKIYESAKTTRAQMRLVDVAGIDARALGEARAADALAIVLAGFGPDADPVRDLESFRSELAVTDLQTVEKVRERVSKQIKSGGEAAKAELDVTVRAEAVLSDGRWLSEEPWSDDERRVLSLWTPLTLKPALHVINAEEPGTSVEVIAGTVVVICGALEAEATELPPEEGADLLEGFGITEPAAGAFIKAAYDAIGLLTFYTGGPTEARAWECKVGSKAPQAAGVIHSDFERAFIRAERVSYDDIVDAGSEDVAKQKGLLRVEGKDYVVQDGDVLNIRHSA